MRLRLLSLLLPLALAACGSTPTAPSPERILVVPTSAVREAVTITAAAAPVAMAPTRAAPALSVEDSARINTSEMWSEPIDPDAEPVEIE